MKFSCEKALLQSAVTVSSRAVAVKSSIPALEGLLIEAKERELRITGFDLKTGIRTVVPAEVREEGSMVLSARLFGEIVRKMPDDVVVLTTERFTVRLRCGMSEFNIQGIDATEYPDLPAVEYMNTFHIRQSALRDMIERTSHAISQSDARPIHTGALFELEQGEENRLTVVAVDGFRLALRRESVSDVTGAKSFQFVVPGSALKEVQRIAGDTEQPMEVVQGERHIMFKTGDVTLITRRLEGEFLNYRKSIPTDAPIRVTVDTRRLTESIERCSLLISEQQKAPLRCTFRQGVVSIKATTPLGNAYDECPVAGDGNGLEIGFNNRYLLEALRAAPTSSVNLAMNTPVSPCVITPGEEGNVSADAFIFMVLPVRLKAN